MKKFAKKITLQSVVILCDQFCRNLRRLFITSDEIIPELENTLGLRPVRQLQLIIVHELQVVRNECRLVNEGDYIPLIIKRMLVEDLQSVGALAEVEKRKYMLLLYH